VRVKLLRINGPTIKTNGLDVNFNYRFDDIMNGTLTLGMLGTYIHEYKVSPFTLGGVPIPGFEASGFFNSGTIAYPIPKYKGQLYANFELGGFNFRWTARYTHSYRDQRSTLFAFNPIYTTPTNPTGIVSNGSVIPSIVLHDVAIRVPLPSFSMAHDVVLTAAIQNIFDKDPPFARTDLNYDALTGDPLGRTIKVGLQAKF